MQTSDVTNYLLLGGGALLVECARELRAAGAAVAVITSPRHQREVVSAEGRTLGEQLAALGIGCVVCSDLDRDADVLGRINDGTLALSFGAAWIFRPAFIARFNGRLLNLHPARLPQDRGAGGFSWQILRDNRLGCCLLHEVDAGVDTGPVVKSRSFVFPPSCRTPADYMAAYIGESRTLLREFFEEVRAGREFTAMPQAEYLSSYWPRLSTEHHGYIDWTWKLTDIECFIRAFDEPFRGASSFINGRRAFLKGGFADIGGGHFHPFQSGLVFRKSEGLLMVATEGGALGITHVAGEDGQDLMGAIQLGDRFHTPRDLLEKALTYRAVFTPEGLKDK